MTSPRAATAISLSREKYPFTIDHLLKKPTFCVGHATASIAKNQVGLHNILGTDSGNSKNLAHFIADTLNDNFMKPLLLPCSDIAQNTISQILAEKGWSVEKLVVYKTKANNNLKDALEKALLKEPNVLVFYSPSVIENMVISLNNDPSNFRKFENIAIGPVTEQALLSFGINVNGTLEKPEPQALLQVIQSLA